MESGKTRRTRSSDRAESGVRDPLRRQPLRRRADLFARHRRVYPRAIALVQSIRMDDARLGSVIRAVRMRLGQRQSDVALRAGVGHATVSLIERGAIEAMTVHTLRRVCISLGISLTFDSRWRGSDLARLMDEGHARIVRDVVTRLTALGWVTRPEHTFNVRGERGSIDVLAWQPARRALLVVEVKTRVVDLQDLLSTLDRKRRLAPVFGRDLDWTPVWLGTVLVLPDENWARNAVARFEAIFRSALPDASTEVRRWLRQPDRGLRAIWFIPDASGGGAKASRGLGLRVRKRPLVRRGGAPRSHFSESPSCGSTAPERSPSDAA